MHDLNAQMRPLTWKRLPGEVLPMLVTGEPIGDAPRYGAPAAATGGGGGSGSFAFEGGSRFFFRSDLRRPMLRAGTLSPPPLGAPSGGGAGAGPKPKRSSGW